MEISRRTLFELHPGRQDHQLPSNIYLDELSPPRRSDSAIHISTSEDLIAALGPIGTEYVRPEGLLGKVDLSYIKNPMLLTLDRRKAIEEAVKVEEETKRLNNEGNRVRRLKDVLVQYLQHVDPILKYHARFKESHFVNPRLDDALLKVLDKYNSRLLNFGGWDITDLMNWAWILTSETTERAATRLLALAHQGFTKMKGGRSIPQFVFLFLLRRRNQSPEALRSLLIYAWELMEKSESLLEPLVPLDKHANETLPGNGLTSIRLVKSVEDDPLGMRESVFMIMIIRLLRSARRVWPAACVSIVALINRYLDGLNFRKGVSQTTILTSEDTAQLTFMYNSLLKLVSLPASIGPFQSVFHQQRAQFNLLKRMNQFQPPLTVDRRGYRAVVSMQLMHKKTLKEREWASMKAKSWPPWKEEKLGIDADINVEHGISRAMEALRGSWEAGYGPDNWDAMASILSGWDTDRSPTIQTRAIRHPHSRRTKESEVWASRIQATRTLDEAWSCFLSYKDHNLESSKGSTVYHQMFGKIIQDAKRLAAEDNNPIETRHADEQPPLPGDGIEVMAAPESPREGVYIRRPPPTVDEFLEIMVKDEVRLSNKFLRSLLANAPTLEIGLHYFEASTEPDAHVFVLSDEQPLNTPEAQAALATIPSFIFTSLIQLLTRFSLKMPTKDLIGTAALAQSGSELGTLEEKGESPQPASVQSSPDSDQSLEVPPCPRPMIRNPLLKALQLVLTRKPRYRPAWYPLLLALSDPRVVIDVSSRVADYDYQHIEAWQMTCRILNEMLEIDLTIDLYCFRILCVTLEKAIFAGERLSRNPHLQPGDKESRDKMSSYVDYVLSTGLPLLKEIFKDLVRAKSMQQDMPVSLREANLKIDEFIEEQSISEPDGMEEDVQDKSTAESNAHLPPGCLLPKLLEVPHPACLHAFIRVLGLRRDYDGLMDLVEWMSLFADDINSVADETANGHRMMRRCVTAIHVFIERSWIALERSEAEAHGESLNILREEQEIRAEPAPAAIVKGIEEILKGNQQWGGLPTPREVMGYCENGKFI